MEILVTGGAGYIGSHIIVELLNVGHQIIVVDNFINSNPESLNRVSEITGKEIKIYKTSILDKRRLEKVFSENNIQSVIHCAGLKAVGESVKTPLKYYENNISGTIVLCDVMKKYNVKKLVFSSSATVYGKPMKFPIDESFSLNATNPYGRTKLMIEEILKDLYVSDNEWCISILRYFNPIGAHPSGKIGEDPVGIPNNLIPFITKVAIGELKELIVFGADYPTLDGTGIRDYIHVVDLALGHIKALEKRSNISGIHTYNLGTGRGYSVLEIIHSFEKNFGRKIPYRVVERRPGDIAVCYADSSKAEQELGWKATRGIEEMCKDSWHWQFKNRQGYKFKQSLMEDSKKSLLHSSKGDFFE